MRQQPTSNFFQAIGDGVVITASDNTLTVYEHTLTNETNGSDDDGEETKGSIKKGGVHPGWFAFVGGAVLASIIVAVVAINKSNKEEKEVVVDVAENSAEKVRKNHEID